MTVCRVTKANKKAGGAQPPSTPKKNSGGVSKSKKDKGTPTPKKGKDNAKDKPEAEEHIPPCFQCLNSATAGKKRREMLWLPGNNRYVRCGRGGNCYPIPLVAKDAAVYFLRYHQSNPPVEDEELPKCKSKKPC
ncbi:hypothetical protein FVEG_11199 [Fusarium verticillioides 7600]|uniref:Uncharacterized protein n=1 Tax=Gibberella moniliformis (strain M3125 / FGSC 7600) TaxID=334819 RepID=W7MXB5_GIBM7|nr:hypothetical protein FVEG_11199 [Fusarium verticillioides 7600]EWG52454.1 hypothetical protein FVEG_11199 [Fusarium verticillioides 7600]RBR01836.1 hypothetical protein FVER53263_11199 [Fusarium verticillioides]